MNNVFELKAVILSPPMCRDGSYHTYNKEMGVFSSRHKAETYMQLMIKQMEQRQKDKETDDEFFAFFIYLKTLDEGLLDPKHEVSEFQEVWSYYGDGSFYCHGSCDENCRKPFRGRLARTIHLRVDDPAWYWSHNCITPCIVSHLPLTNVGYRRWAKRLGHDVGLDCTDDCYTVILYDNQHAHPQTWELFPFFGPISRRNLNRLLASQKEFDSR